MGVMLRWCTVLVAVTMLAAACGGGGDGDAVAAEPAPATDEQTPDRSDGESEPPTEEVDEGPVTSVDGRLVATPPRGAGPITVEPGEPIAALDGLGVSVAAYELGPDGSVFDEPVELRFAVDAATAMSGIIVTAESSDGTLDALAVTIEQTADGFEAVALLDHFTRVDLRSGVASPVAVLDSDRFEIGTDFAAGLRAGVGVDVVPGAVSDVAVEFRGISEPAWTTSGVVTTTSTATDVFVCERPGGGLVALSGVMRIEVLGSAGSAAPQPLTWPTEVPVVDLEVPVECNAPATELAVLDMRCIDRLTGETADGCAYPDVVSISNPDNPEILVAGATMTDADIDVVLSIYTGEILAECDLVGVCNVFSAPSFGGVETDWPTSGVTVGEGTFRFSQVPLRSGPDGVVVDVPPGVDMFEGSDLPGGPQPLVEVTVFVHVGDIQSTTLLDPEDVQGFFAGP